MTFPLHRPRRLRRSEALRGFVRETRLSTERPCLSDVRVPRQQGPHRSQLNARHLPAVARSNCRGVPRSRRSRHSRRDSLRPARAQGRNRLRSRRSERAPCSARSTRSARRSSICSSSPTFACANTPATATAAWSKEAKFSTIRARAAGRCGAFARARRRRYRRALRHDGRPRRRHPRASSTPTDFRTSQSSPTRRNIAPRSTARFARPRNRRRSSAIAAAIRWIRPTRARLCAKWRSISKRARTSSWSSPRCRISISSSACASASTFPSPRTTSAANSRW